MSAYGPRQADELCDRHGFAPPQAFGRIQVPEPGLDFVIRPPLSLERLLCPSDDIARVRSVERYGRALRALVLAVVEADPKEAMRLSVAQRRDIDRATPKRIGR